MQIAHRASVIAVLGATTALALGACSRTPPPPQAPSAAERYDDASAGDDWPGYGRTYGEQHYSPLTDVDTKNVERLGLAWSLDLPFAGTATQPVAVDGVLYFSIGYNIVYAVDAVTGKQLWMNDLEGAAGAGHRLRLGWGSRGLAWWNGRIYAATWNGRLVALDAKTGKQAWSAQVLDPKGNEYISGAPRVFDGKVIIGSGSDIGYVRGQVNTYDAETGRFLWRFWIVPGDPAKGFENAAMEMAAKTWAGEWWKHGGGGASWNSFAYDAATDTVFVGTGNGYPWNRRVRSADQGDNLFLCSVLALDAKTGEYRWHYQINPGDTWDYNAAMDLHLADLVIDGKPRKTLLTAPKNGFLYVIDRTDGRLISAEQMARRITWATHIDLATGRPVETPDARYPGGKTFELWPSAAGAHSWPPSAWNPRRGLMFIPTLETGMTMNDVGIDPKTWERRPNEVVGAAFHMSAPAPDPLHGTGALLAWDPVAKKAAWRVEQPTQANGGLLATAGDLVFQGTPDGRFTAYDAESGKVVWSFEAQAPVFAPPLSYRAGGKQYVTVLTGLGTTAGVGGAALAKLGYDVDPRSQKRRVLAFALDGKVTLPPRQPQAPIMADPTYRADAAAAARGATVYGYCMYCHGLEAVPAGHAPDLRRSPIPFDAQAFDAVVRGGSLLDRGMPRFTEFSDQELADLRQHIRAAAARGREAAAISNRSTR
jgi:quinohemoprotein ethanol dehydrogenase